MGRTKKPTYKPRSFESRNCGGSFINQRGKNQAETSANIFESMLQSPAFKSLTAKQQILYVYCKSQYYGKRKPAKDYEKKGLYQDQAHFYFNWQLALDYDLYTEKSHSGFYKDMKALMQKGFFELVKSGKEHKTKNIYKFSDKWQEWGQI